MLLISCKVKLSLTWNENCVLSSEDGNSVFAITDAKLYVPIVTLSAEENAKLSKLLGEGFKRSINWNKYRLIPNKKYNANDYIRELLDSSYQKYNANDHIRELLDSSYRGVKRLFVLAYDNTNGITAHSYRRYFLPSIKIENYNIEIDGRNFYHQAINDTIKQYDEVRKVSTGQGDDYTTGCLLDFAYFEKDYKLIAVDLSKQKAPEAIQQIIFTGTAGGATTVFYILEQSKETILEFVKGTYKRLNTVK